MPLCPRCNMFPTGEHPATSRRDNKTGICSSCGANEALFDMVIADGLKDNRITKENADQMKARESAWLTKEKTDDIDLSF